MTFVLTRRGGMWRAAAEGVSIEFVCPDQTYRTTSAGMYHEASSRDAAVIGFLGMWTRFMLEPLAAAGNSPSTVTPIVGYCAMIEPGSESEV
jgi:hypothetical protein